MCSDLSKWLNEPGFLKGFIRLGIFHLDSCYRQLEYVFATFNYKYPNVSTYIFRHIIVDKCQYRYIKKYAHEIFLNMGHILFVFICKTTHFTMYTNSFVLDHHITCVYDMRPCIK